MVWHEWKEEPVILCQESSIRAIVRKVRPVRIVPKSRELWHGGNCDYLAGVRYFFSREFMGKAFAEWSDPVMPEMPFIIEHLPDWAAVHPFTSGPRTAATFGTYFLMKSKREVFPVRSS